MSNPPMVQVLPQSSRPPLDLGAMGGTRDEIVERMDDLVSMFNTLMGTELELVNDPTGGATDCKTVIRVPFDDPEAYLVCEHELSHPFSGTDLELTEAFREKAVERLLTRAGIPITSPDAIPYKAKLAMLVHNLWNVLEDWRSCSVWGEVYYGGAMLLQKRWKAIAEYDRSKDAETDLGAYLARLAAGFDTPTAPPEFRRCAPHMIAARAQVELVDNKACLAITARLIDEIADELLGHYPPPPKAKNSPRQQAQHKLKILAQALPNPQSSSASNPQPDPGKLGSKDLRPDPTKPKNKRRVSAKTMGQLRKLMTANDKDGDPANGKKSSLKRLLDDGTTKMNSRIAAAKKKLGQQTKSEQNQHDEMMANAGRVCGIKTFHVVPSNPLPKPSRKAGAMRRYLEQVHLEQTHISSFAGTKVNVPAIIQARLSGNMGTVPIFTKTVESGGLQLLILADVSGSMVGHGLEMLEQALSDVQFSCRGLPVDLHLWCFSSDLYFFDKFGSPRGAQGVQMMYTSMVQALDVAVEWSRAGRVDRGIILITDGQPTSNRHRKSTGNASLDLQAVMKELRADGVILSALAIGSKTDQYDLVFGEKKYALVKSLGDIPKALADAARVIVEAHLRK